MADSILNIVIRARDETQAAFTVIRQQLKDIENSLKGLSGAGSGIGDGVKGAGEEFDKLKDSVDKTNGALKNTASQSKATSVEMEALYSIAKRITAVFAGFFTVAYIKNLADGAARTEVLGTVLQQVAKNAGITADYIENVDEQVQALGITAESSRQSLSQFIQSGLDITKAAELARASQDLAVISGRDSSETFARLITSVQQMNTVSLRWMGIIVDVEQATQRYAAANNLAASSISRSVKQQIVLDSVLEQSVKLQGLYEASLTNVGKQLSSLARYQKEASDAAGNLLLPAYLELVKEFTTFLKQVQLIAESMNANTGATLSFAKAVRLVASALREMLVFVIQNAKALAELGAVLYIVFNWNRLVTAGLTYLAGAMSRLLLIIPRLIVAWKALNVAFATSPIGMTIIAVSLLGTAVYALWEIFASKKPANALEELQDQYRVLIDLTEKEANAKKALDEARLGKGSTSIEDAKAEYDMIVEQRKATQEKIKELKEAGKVTDENARKVEAEANAQTEAARQFQKTKKEIDDVNEKLIKMGVFGNAARKGLDISAGFEEKVGAFDAAIEAYRDGLKNFDGSVVVTQGQIDLMAEGIIEAAKTTEEMRAALDRLGREGSVNISRIAPKLRELEMKEAKAGVEKATQALALFMEKSEQAGSTLSVLSAVEDVVRESSSDLAQELLRLGIAVDSQMADIDALTGKMQVTAQTQRALGEAERQELRNTADTARQRYENEITRINNLKNARIAAAQNLVGEARGTQSAIIRAEREAATSSIAEAKKRFDVLSKLQADYLRLAKASAEEIKAIDEEIYQSKRTLEEKLFNLNLKGKTDEQKQAYLLEEIQKRTAAAEAARLQGNFDLAKRLNDERIAMVDKLSVPENATEQQKAIIANQLVTAYKQQTDILTAQKRIKEEARDANITEYKATLTEVKKITEELVTFSQDQVMKLSVELDSGSLDTMVQQIQDAVRNISVSLNISTNRTERFASGGLVSGPGTTKSDSILARLSNNEFVMNADAVSHYGVRFMDMLNRMALPAVPRFATGGLVSAPAVSSASVGGSRDTVDVNFNVGGQKISLMGERTQVRRLVSSLKNLQGV